MCLKVSFSLLQNFYYAFYYHFIYVILLPVYIILLYIISRPTFILFYALSQYLIVIIIFTRFLTLQELTSSDIEKCLYSIGDNHAFLRGARDPIDKMIVYLF